MAWILPSIDHALMTQGIECVAITNALLRSVHKERREIWIQWRHFHYLWIWNGRRWIWRPPPPQLTRPPKCRCRRKSVTREFSFLAERVGSEDPPPLRCRTSVPTYKSSSPVETGQSQCPCVTRTASKIVFECNSNSCVHGTCGREKGEALAAKLGGNSEFARVDIDDVNSLETALKSKLLSLATYLRSVPNAYELESIMNVVIVNVNLCRCRSRSSCCWSLPTRRKV